MYESILISRPLTSDTNTPFADLADESSACNLFECLPRLTHRSVAEDNLAMAAAAELTPASVSRDSAAETEVRGVLAPVVDTDALPETDALAACDSFETSISMSRRTAGHRRAARKSPFLPTSIDTTKVIQLCLARLGHQTYSRYTPFVSMRKEPCCKFRPGIYR